MKCSVLKHSLLKSTITLKPCKTVSQITYTVLVETLNDAQSNPIAEASRGLSKNCETVISIASGILARVVITGLGIGMSGVKEISVKIWS